MFWAEAPVSVVSSGIGVFGRTALALRRAAGRAGLTCGVGRHRAAKDPKLRGGHRGARPEDGCARRDDRGVDHPSPIVATTAVGPVGDPRYHEGIRGNDHGNRRRGDEEQNEQQPSREPEPRDHVVRSGSEHRRSSICRGVTHQNGTAGHRLTTPNATATRPLPARTEARLRTFSIRCQGLGRLPKEDALSQKHEVVEAVISNHRTGTPRQASQGDPDSILVLSGHPERPRFRTAAGAATPRPKWRHGPGRAAGPGPAPAAVAWRPALRSAAGIPSA